MISRRQFLRASAAAGAASASLLPSSALAAQALTFSRQNLSKMLPLTEGTTPMAGVRPVAATAATAVPEAVSANPLLTPPNLAVRSLSLYQTRTRETLTIDYFVDGRYRPEALARLNHVLRDWHTGQMADMDPALIDILSALQRAAGHDRPLHVTSAYRTPNTNAALARRRSGVAVNSLHMAGQAVDLFLPGYSLRGLRSHALELKAGGVGYYPRSGFIHVDSGDVRSWG